MDVNERRIATRHTAHAKHVPSTPVILTRALMSMRLVSESLSRSKVFLLALRVLASNVSFRSNNVASTTRSCDCATSLSFFSSLPSAMCRRSSWRLCAMSFRFRVNDVVEPSTEPSLTNPASPIGAAAPKVGGRCWSSSAIVESSSPAEVLKSAEKKQAGENREKETALLEKHSHRISSTRALL